MRPTSKEMLEAGRVPYPFSGPEPFWQGGGLSALVLGCLGFFPVYIVWFLS